MPRSEDDGSDNGGGLILRRGMHPTIAEINCNCLYFQEWLLGVQIIAFSLRNFKMNVFVEISN